MSSWSGKSKGSVLGYKIFVFAIEKTGLRAAYFILRFVSFYYFLFSWKTSSCLFYYFRKRLHYGPVKSILRIYSNYYLLGQTLIDKIAVLAGYKTKFTFTIQGEEYLTQMVKANKGGILISAHIGNWELAGHVLRGIAAKVNIVMYEGEHTAIKKYMDSIMKESKVMSMQMTTRIKLMFFHHRSKYAGLGCEMRCDEDSQRRYERSFSQFLSSCERLTRVSSAASRGPEPGASSSITMDISSATPTRASRLLGWAVMFLSA